MDVLRSGWRMEKQGKRAVSRGKNHVNGVKGPSIISALPGIDIGTCVLPEVLHSALLGIGKQFLCLWIEKKGDWNISRNLESMNTDIKNIEPPRSFSRMPRSLSLYQIFKGHEFLNWILFYSVPILRKYLQEKYFEHWLLFVRALFILLQSRITKRDLKEATILMRLFVRDIDTLYGDRHLTYNTHQMLHLALSVERWGPLWATSAFVFESFNGTISRLIHGSKHHGQELINKLRIAMGVEMLKNRAVVLESDRNSVLDGIQNNDVIGKNVDIFLLDAEKELLALSGLNNLTFFARAKIRGEIFTSQAYKKTKTNSHTIKIYENNDSSGKYATIRCFFKTDNNLCFIILQNFEIDETNMIRHADTGICISNIIPVKERNSFSVINLRVIHKVYQVVRVQNYICDRPNYLRKIL